MSEFDALFATEAGPSLFEMYADPCVYHPSGGRPRTVWAIVNTRAPEPVGEVPSLIVARATIDVFSDPTTETYGGISEEELNTGGDKFEVTMRAGKPGAAKVSLSMQKLVDASGGMLKIELQ